MLCVVTCSAYARLGDMLVAFYNLHMAPNLSWSVATVHMVHIVQSKTSMVASSGRLGLRTLA